VNSVFFYGLFMDASLLEEMGLHPNVIGPAKLPDFQIRIRKRATLIANRGSTSYGVVMELSGKETAALYSKPGVSDYRPETVDAILIGDGSVHRSLCYNLPPGVSESGTDATYAAKLSALVLKLGFSSEYASEITSRHDA
jgi:hypothetical protein